MFEQPFIGKQCAPINIALYFISFFAKIIHLACTGKRKQNIFFYQKEKDFKTSFIPSSEIE